LAFKTSAKTQSFCFREVVQKKRRKRRFLFGVCKHEATQKKKDEGFGTILAPLKKGRVPSLSLAQLVFFFVMAVPEFEQS